MTEYLKYHINSNNYPSQSKYKKGNYYLNKITIEEKSLQKTPLEPIEQTARINSNCSRTFINNMNYNNLSKLLINSYSFDEKFKNLVPSAGGFYPVTLYVYINNIGNIFDGFYHYNSISKELELINTYKLNRNDNIFWGNNSFAYDAQIVIFFVANLKYSFPKYGDKAYRFCLIESGHICQKLIEQSIYLKLNYCPIGGYWEETIENILNLSKEEFLIYCLAVG